MDIHLMTMTIGVVAMAFIGKPVGIMAIGVILRSSQTSNFSYSGFMELHKPCIDGWLLGCVELEWKYEYIRRNSARGCLCRCDNTLWRWRMNPRSQ